jgi:hypothetical protein
MALTSNGLTNGGLTGFYQFQYDDSLAGANEPGRTNQVIASADADFNQMSGWFRNISLGGNGPISVNIIPPGQPGACTNTGACWGIAAGTLKVTISLQNIDAVGIRYLIVAEVVERFMQVQSSGWFGAGTEGSQGEGLSRFLAAQLLAVNGLGKPPAGFYNSNAWLSTSRTDFVNSTAATDDGPDAVTGCSLLFIYYLFSNLTFSIDAIVGAGAATLGGVYRNLTGVSADPFPAFSRLLGTYFPGTSTITKGNLDNPFPLNDPILTSTGILWHNSATGGIEIWHMSGSSGPHSVASRATVLGETGNPTFIGPPWSIAATSDFNHDDTADILWHNSATGEIQIWFMNGAHGPQSVASRATVLGETGSPTFIGPPWSIVGADVFATELPWQG